jgi:hypothetical protein
MALVVPVPEGVGKEQVRAAAAEVVAHLEAFTAPRFVERWEEDPCAEAADAGVRGAGARASAGKPMASAPASMADKVAAWKARAGGGKAAAASAPAPAGDYEITLLGAADSLALDAWLGKNGYRLPEGAAATLRPYVEGGSRFVVARIDGAKLAFANGRAKLPPLSLAFEAETPKLPLGAALVSAPGALDVTVQVLGRARYEPADASPTPIPTGLEVTAAARDALAPFYAALFDLTAAYGKGAFVVEHAGAVGACASGCTAAPLGVADLAALGAEPAARAGDAMLPPRVVLGTPEIAGTVKDAARGLKGAEDGFRRCYAEALRDKPDARGSLRLTATLVDTGEVTTATPSDVKGLPAKLVECLTDRLKNAQFSHLADEARAGIVVPVSFTPPSVVLTPKNVLATRLHARFAKGARVADVVLRPVTGGDAAATLVASYEIRHAWSGEAACASPKRGAWGGPPEGGEPAVVAIEGIAHANRDGVELAKLVAEDVPAIGFDRKAPAKAAEGAGGGVIAASVTSAGASAAATATPISAPASEPAPARSRGCFGSIAGERAPSALGWVIAGLAAGAAAMGRRRRRG